MIRRRGLIGGLIGLIAAPAVVRAESLMRVSVPRPTVTLWLIGWGDAPLYGVVPRDDDYRLYQVAFNEAWAATHAEQAISAAMGDLAAFGSGGTRFNPTTGYFESVGPLGLHYAVDPSTPSGEIELRSGGQSVRATNLTV